MLRENVVVLKCNMVLFTLCTKHHNKVSVFAFQCWSY